jgi:vancomycin resistance protein YoaR
LSNGDGEHSIGWAHASSERTPALIRAHPWRLVLGAAALLVAAVTVVVAADARARIPERVEIADVAVGGASAVEAEHLVRARAKELAQRPLLVVGPEGFVRTSGVQLGARPQVTAAVAAAGLRRFARARGWLDGERVRTLPLRWEVDVGAVRQLAERFGPAAPPSEATVEVRADGVHVRAGHAGYEVDSEALRSRLESLPPRVHVPTTHVDPEVTTAEARATAHQIERLTRTPRTILLGSVATTLEPTTLRALVRVHPGEGGLTVSFDAGRLAKLLPASVAPRDAELRVRGANIELVPAVQGRILDVAATARRLVESDRSRVEAAVTLVQPGVTTAELASLGIRDRVSEFTTHYPPGQPRVVNIQRAAAVIDGTILPPGARFSMNEALGERTIAKGYVPAPQIAAGNSFADSVGGGISQVATTLYNGAFFAGLELIEHQPHSLYIDRYPLGREATISWGGPELIFRNDWPASVLIKLDATDTSITVRFFSSRLGRRVETETSLPYGHGGGSFMVDYTRRVYRGTRLVRDERFRVRYGVSPGSGAPGGT